jgi:phage terminase large subunit
MSSMQGHHDGAMVIVADEAQALEEEQLQAIQGNVVGADNWLVMLGNPLVMGGPFAKVAQSGDDTWSRTKVTAYDVINDPEAAGMRGLVTLDGVNRIRQSWGQESSVFGSRVLAEFPRTPDDAMFSPDLITEAFRKHRTGELLDSVQQKTRVLGIDVAASTDGDETVIASARGGHVEEITSWHEADTMRTVGKVEEYLRRRGIPRKPPTGAGQPHPFFGQSMPGDPLEFVGKPAIIRVDEIGVGRGVSDRLKEKGYPCQPFNASKRPETSEDAMTRFQNRRAEAFDRFRTLLVKGKIALPYDSQLEEELQTCRAFTNAMGRLQIIDKGDWKLVLGRSPDRLDAVVIAVAGSGAVTFEAMNRIPARGIAL